MAPWTVHPEGHERADSLGQTLPQQHQSIVRMRTLWSWASSCQCVGLRGHTENITPTPKLREEHILQSGASRGPALCPRGGHRPRCWFRTFCIVWSSARSGCHLAVAHFELCRIWDHTQFSVTLCFLPLLSIFHVGPCSLWKPYHVPFSQVQCLLDRHLVH